MLARKLSQSEQALLTVFRSEIERKNITVLKLVCLFL